MNRLETPLGNDGLSPGCNTRQGRFRAFGARYYFAGLCWGITVWARDLDDAQEYARRHGLTIDGEIVGVYKE